MNSRSCRLPFRQITVRWCRCLRVVSCVWYFCPTLHCCHSRPWWPRLLCPSQGQRPTKSSSRTRTRCWQLWNVQQTPGTFSSCSVITLSSVTSRRLVYFFFLVMYFFKPGHVSDFVDRVAVPFSSYYRMHYREVESRMFWSMLMRIFGYAFLCQFFFFWKS